MPVVLFQKKRTRHRNCSAGSRSSGRQPCRIRRVAGPPGVQRPRAAMTRPGRPGSLVFKKIAYNRVCGGENSRTCAGAGEGLIPPVAHQQSNPPGQIPDINFVCIHSVSGRGSGRHGLHSGNSSGRRIGQPEDIFPKSTGLLQLTVRLWGARPGQDERPKRLPKNLRTDPITPPCSCAPGATGAAGGTSPGGGM
jgi:hypothetical protein